MRTLILSFLLLTGCAHEKWPVYIDPELKPYLEQYVKLKMQYTGNPYHRRMSIVFYSGTTPEIGNCTISDFGRKVGIQKEFWYDPYTLESDRLTLFLHEMGHCDLNLEHSTEYGIMNELHMDGINYEVAPDYYLKKFFLEGK